MLNLLSVFEDISNSKKCSVKQPLKTTGKVAGYLGFPQQNFLLFWERNDIITLRVCIIYMYVFSDHKFK